MVALELSAVQGVVEVDVRIDGVNGAHPGTISARQRVWPPTAEAMRGQRLHGWAGLGRAQYARRLREWVAQTRPKVTLAE